MQVQQPWLMALKECTPFSWDLSPLPRKAAVFNSPDRKAQFSVPRSSLCFSDHSGTQVDRRCLGRTMQMWSGTGTREGQAMWPGLVLRDKTCFGLCWVRSRWCSNHMNLHVRVWARTQSVEIHDLHSLQFPSHHQYRNRTKRAFHSFSTTQSLILLS